MSVQLIVYPQNFDGVTNAISGSSTEFIVNGINFTNLSDANSYDSNTSSLGSISMIVFNSNNTISNWSTNNIPSTSYSITYTASDTAMTFFISYQNTSATTWTINNISVQPVVGAVNSGAIQILGDGQVIVDLYEDEDLPLTLSVDDFKNVAEKVQSYSKAFNLPATKRNNIIFDHIFEITREVVSAGGLLFNPYKRTQCVLKQDGFILFEGFLRLLDVTDKEGEISYNVNLYSEVVALADTLKDRAFRDLDFKEQDTIII